MSNVVLVDAPCYVTLCYHYTPECWPEQEGFILYISKVTNYIWESVKKNYFLTQDYVAANLCTTRKEGLLYCCWYCWYCYCHHHHNHQNYIKNDYNYNKKDNITTTATTTGEQQKWTKLATNMNRNFTEVKTMTWLLLMELEREVEDVNGNEMCTDRTMWNILCELCTDRTMWNTLRELSAQKWALLCDCWHVFLWLHWVNSDRGVQTKGSNKICQTSAEGTELLLRGWWRGNVCVFIRTVLWLNYEDLHF